MNDVPYLNVLAWVSQARAELIPLALHEWIRKTSGKRQAASESARERLLERVRGWEVDAQLRTWMQTRASMASWRALDSAFDDLFAFLAKAEASNPVARELIAELVGCPTLLNTARIALRGPVAT